MALPQWPSQPPKWLKPKVGTHQLYLSTARKTHISDTFNNNQHGVCTRNNVLSARERPHCHKTIEGKGSDFFTGNNYISMWKKLGEA
jgi:hypothetical protein